MNSILQLLLTDTFEHFDIFNEVYVFGSVLWSRAPGDLDILLIYETVNLPLVPDAEQRIITEMSDVFPDLPVHLTTLSYSELMSTDFLTRIMFVRIK